MQKFNLRDLIIAYALGILPFALIISILTLLRIAPVIFNGTPQYGFTGFILALLLSTIFGLIMGIVSYIALSIGRFIYNKLLHKETFKH